MSRSVCEIDNNTLYEIFGGRKEQRASLIEPLKWAKKVLFPRHSVHIKVNLKKLDEGYEGFCMIADGELYRPREFDILISKSCTPEEMLITLFHEVVHAKQYAKNEFQIRMRPTVHRRWFGEHVSEKEVGYYNLPWEQEAYALQDVLMEEWKKYNGQL